MNNSLVFSLNAGKADFVTDFFSLWVKARKLKSVNERLEIYFRNDVFERIYPKEIP